MTHLWNRRMAMSCAWRSLLAGLALLLFAASIGAVEPARAPNIAAFLAAGEFGPAQAAARQIANPAERERALRDIALAQSRGGANRGALDTLASMGDDQYRSQAVQQMRSPGGGMGGAAAADFDSLIDLIQSTVHPNTWSDGGTGEGSIEPFPTGVFVDAKGLLSKRVLADGTNQLDELHAAARRYNGNSDLNNLSDLRKVSLTRLEREVQLLYAQGKDPTAAMQNLAGITRVKYVLLYPDSGDIVIAGPAGPWRENAEGRAVSADKGMPVLQLDDLVVVLRNALSKEPKFGCAIKPREENLAKTKAYLTESTKTPLPAGGRTKWVKDLRAALGRQDIEVFGIDARTHAAHILVEADYHMKLVGMGLEEGTLGVKSYLDLVEIGPDGKLPPMDVLRWWFTLNYDAVQATKARDGFEFKGPGVKVLSENEFVTEQGKRIHTGMSDALNSEFAQSFTKHFDTLAGKYPVYAELRNVMDLALVAGLIVGEDLPGQTSWHFTHFGPEGAYQPRLSNAPTEVETVANYRVIGGKRIVAGASGGVLCDTRMLTAKDKIKADDNRLLTSQRDYHAAKQVAPRGWWWD